MNILRPDSDAGSITPMDIAHNPFLGAREKLDLLRQLKAQAASLDEPVPTLGFGAEDVDAAVAEVRRLVQEGMAEDHHIPGARNG
jgi:hypothetical protein